MVNFWALTFTLFYLFATHGAVHYMQEIMAFGCEPQSVSGLR